MRSIPNKSYHNKLLFQKTQNAIYYPDWSAGSIYTIGVSTTFLGPETMIYEGHAADDVTL